MNQDDSLTHTEQALAYDAGYLSPLETVAFEAHLATCKECQELLADARELLPRAKAALATLAGVKPTAASNWTPKYTVEEQVARFDAMVRAEKAQQVRRYRRVGLALAAGVAVAMGIAAYEVLRPQRPTAPAQRLHLYAPAPK